MPSVLLALRHPKMVTGRTLSALLLGLHSGDAASETFDLHTLVPFMGLAAFTVSRSLYFLKVQNLWYKISS